MRKKSIVGKYFALFLALVIIYTCNYSPIQVNAASPYNNLILESVFFTDGNGMVVVSPEGKDDLVPYVVLSKAEGGTAFAGTVIVATYDGSELHDVSTFDVNSSNVVYGETAFTIERNTYKASAVSFPANGTAKAFYLNSLDQIVPYISPTSSDMAPTGSQYTGVITFPTKFQSKMTGKFEITKEQGIRRYSHNATPQKLYDWSDATEIFLSSTVNYASSQVVNELGKDRSKPIAGRNFATHFKNSDYKKADGLTAQDKFIFTLLDDMYMGATDPHAIPLNNLGTSTNNNIPTAINALIRSGSPSGFTWMGRIRNQNIPTDIAQKWAPVSGKTGVYMTTQAGGSSATILTAMNFNAKDEYGMPRPYVLVNSVDEVAVKKGTFYQDSAAKSNIYCNPYDGHNLDDITLVVETGLIDGIRNDFNKTIVFQNVGIMPRLTSNNDNQFKGTSFDTSVIGFFGCKFAGGATNTLSLTGKYTAYLFDCVSAYGFRDGLNYHGDIITNSNSTTIEVNSTSYCHGDSNRITYSAQITDGSTNNSNNASTSHDGNNILRVGGRYWDTQGPIVGDESCYSISLGCESYNFNTRSPSERTAFMEYDSTNQITAGNNKFVVDCLGTGIKIRAGVVGNANTYVLDFVGNTRLGLGAAGTADPLKPITWDEIASGAWK